MITNQVRMKRTAAHRKSIVGFSIAALVICAVFFARSSVWADTGISFSRLLSLGSVGADVLRLQRFLNGDPDTRVAAVGPGSPGQETSVFGPLTQAAVNKFQQKYRSDILASGQSPTGTVGPKTLRQLNALLDKFAARRTPSAAPASVPPPVSAVSTPKSVTVPVPPPTFTPAPSSAPASVGNPNLINLDKFIADINRVGKNRGYSDSQLANASALVQNAAAGPMDFRKEFQKAWNKQAQTSAKNISPKPIPLGVFFRNLISLFNPRPAIANAQGVSGSPFGGAIYYVFFCDCSGDWLVGMQPLPPDYPVLLTYYEGMQEFSNYNTPFTTEVLGTYDPGAGVCMEVSGPDCFEIPSEGMMTGFLGSSGM